MSNRIYYKALAQSQAIALVKTLGKIKDESASWMDEIKNIILHLSNLTKHFNSEEVEWMNNNNKEKNEVH